MSNSFDELPETSVPYQAGNLPSVSPQSSNPLFIPGIIFLLDSLFWLLYIMLGMASLCSSYGPFRGEESAFIRIELAVSYALMFVVSLVAVAGAVAMMMLKQKWLAWTGSIVGMLPLFGPCFGLTIPIAIWALVLLRRREVSARFT